jgi:hypothetical protein
VPPADKGARARRTRWKKLAHLPRDDDNTIKRYGLAQTVLRAHNVGSDSSLTKQEHRHPLLLAFLLKGGP